MGSSVFAVVCALVCFGLIGPAAAQQQNDSAPLPAVSYIEAAAKDVTPSETFVGRVEAVQRVDLRARVTGFLEKQIFDDGEMVEAGDVLFIIEQAPFAARVQEAEANLEAARAQLENAKVQLQRAEQLVERGNIPVATVDERRAEFLVAQASVAQSEAALENAKITYSYTEIRSPIDGQMGRSSVKAGNLVSPESGVLATVVQLDPVYVTFNVPAKARLEFRRAVNESAETERDGLGRLLLELQLSDGSTYEHKGRVDFADVQVDATTDTFALRGIFPNPDRLLIDRQFVVVVVQMREPQSALVVPRSTVGVDQRGAFVLAIGEDNRVEQRSVVMGQQFGADVVIEKGLQPGDRVITEGMMKVRPGMEVNPVPASDPKA